MSADPRPSNVEIATDEERAREVARGLTRAQRAYLAANYMEFAAWDRLVGHYPTSDHGENGVMRRLIRAGVLHVSAEHLLQLAPLGRLVAQRLKEMEP